MGPHTFRVWKEKAAERAGGTIFLQFNISSRLRRPLSTTEHDGQGVGPRWRGRPMFVAAVCPLLDGPNQFFFKHRKEI